MPSGQRHTKFNHQRSKTKLIMTNGKKKTSAKALRKARTKTVKVRSAPKAPDLSSHEETIVGLTDPFSEFSSDTRYPDQGSGRTLVTQQRYLCNPTANASGIVAIAFNPKPSWSGITGSTYAGNVVTWTANYNQGDFSTVQDLVNNYGQSYRICSMGVRIANTLSATNSSGYLVIAKGGTVPIGAGLTTTFNPVNFASYDLHPVAHGAEWHATLHPRSAQAYDPDLVATGVSNTYGDDSWETLYIFATGLPASSTPFAIEVVINIEYTCKEDAPISGLARQSPMMDVSIQTAVNHVQNSLPNSHVNSKARVSALIKSEAKKALIKHVLPFAARKLKQAIL